EGGVAGCCWVQGLAELLHVIQRCSHIAAQFLSHDTDSAPQLMKLGKYSIASGTPQIAILLPLPYSTVSDGTVSPATAKPGHRYAEPVGAARVLGGRQASPP